jgi:hypothetical protein
MLVLAVAFSLLFTGKTMRLDYFHTGDHGREIIAVDRIVGMYTRDEVSFCKVCRKAIERVIDLYAIPAKGDSSKAPGI